MALKWGIAGAGKISHDFVTALNIMPDNHQVVAVAARSQKSAENFANQHGITKAYEGYKELALDKNIGKKENYIFNTLYFYIRSYKFQM